MTMRKTSVFDRIINELSLEDTGTEKLDQCMQFNYSLSRKVPLRYKIISVGFVRGYTVEELNNKLQSYGLAKLYARSLWEASLLFAFKNGLSYEDWRSLYEKAARVRKNAQAGKDILAGKSVTLLMLKEYVTGNSDLDVNAELLTEHKTRHIESALSNLKTSEEFVSYLRSNINEFSAVREKTRYYFCKYLIYYLERIIDSFLKISSRGVHYRLEDIMNELSIFQGSSKIKKSTMSQEKIREYLENSPISCSVLYAQFNEFYFGYVSLDWMQILLEQAGDLKNLPSKNTKKLANAARHYDKKYQKMSDEEIIQALNIAMEEEEKLLDQEASLDSGNRGYQKNRMGENTVRKYLKGTLDLDRTTLICFILFLASDLTSPSRLFLDESRLNIILKECGFSSLDSYNDFDFFVINFLNAEDAADYLMEEVTRYALSEENFYLFKFYQISRSEDADLLNLMKTS